MGKGLTTPEACDKILKLGYAARLPAMGAFEHADLAGLDLLNSDAAKAVWEDLSNVSDPADTPVGALFEKGYKGMSSGRGFYDWNVRDPEAFKEGRDREIVRRISLLRVANSRPFVSSGRDRRRCETNPKRELSCSVFGWYRRIPSDRNRFGSGRRAGRALTLWLAAFWGCICIDSSGRHLP